MIIWKHENRWTSLSKREQEEHQLSNKIQDHRPLVILNCQGLQPPDPDEAEEVARHQPVVPARNVAELNQAQLQPVFGKVQLRNVLVIIMCFLSLFGDIAKARGDIAQRHRFGFSPTSLEFESWQFFWQLKYWAMYSKKRKMFGWWMSCEPIKNS